MSDFILFNTKTMRLQFYSSDEALDSLYYLETRFPKLGDINKKTASDKVLKYFSSDPESVLMNLRYRLSRLDNKIPLYDIYSGNLYLITRDNLYNRVMYNSYRFPDEKMYESFLEKKKQMKPVIDEIKKKHGLENKTIKEIGDYEKIHGIIFKLRKYRKLELMIGFLGNFDLSVLERTYIQTIYNYSDEMGKNLTICQRPSFTPYFKHIKPYYTRSEILNIALNLELIKKKDKNYTDSEIADFCDRIKKNDITAKIIIDHLLYTSKSKKIGLIQYFSIQGSYFMNRYLREKVSYTTKNLVLEEAINNIWETINKAPAFDKSYTLYRFVHNDEYIKHLKIGEKYVEPSFISTTRNSLYNPEEYKFGFILIKIKIPGGKQGVALCIESISRFPDEEEIILPPLAILRLDKRDENCVYFHTDQDREVSVKTRYEFTYLGKLPLSFPGSYTEEEKRNLIDFLELRKQTTLTVAEKVKYFTKNYVNEMFQFECMIGKKKYTCMTEWYDSTEAYRGFYALKVDNGFSIYSMDKGNVIFMIEIGEDEKHKYMYVNFYVKKYMSSATREYSDTEFVEFLSGIAYYFDIESIVLYTEYNMCDLSGIEKDDNPEGRLVRKKGVYSSDFYSYLKHSKRRFTELDTVEIKPYFDYYQLDRLRRILPEKLLNKSDMDELFQVYDKTYKPFVEKEKDNLADLYIWLIENNCYLLDCFIAKTPRVYTGDENNPFFNDNYYINPWVYLYNRDMISDYGLDSKLNSSSVDDYFMPKNEYRVTKTIGTTRK